MHKIFDNHCYGGIVTCLHNTHMPFTLVTSLASPIMDCHVVQNTVASN